MLRLSLLFCALVLLASAIAVPSQFDTSDPLPSMPSGSEHHPHHSGDPMMPSQPHHSGDPMPMPSGSHHMEPSMPGHSMPQHSGMPMPSGSGNMPGSAMPTTHTPSTTAASSTPAPTFSPQERDVIKQQVLTIVNNLPSTFNITVIGEPIVSTTGVVEITASIDGGCSTVNASKSQFETADLSVACAAAPVSRRLLAVSQVDLTFTPKQGPTYAPAPTASTDSPASATMPSALAFLAVVVAAIAF